MSILVKAVRKFFTDGTKVLSLLAPTLSILYTAGLAWQWPLMGAWKDLSYAWAFVPLLILAIVAYIRRWKYSLSLEGERDLQAVRDKLAEFREEAVNNLLTIKPNTEDELKDWSDKYTAWVDEVICWMKNNTPKSERLLFQILGIIDVKPMTGSYYYNPEHARLMAFLSSHIVRLEQLLLHYRIN